MSTKHNTNYKISAQAIYRGAFGIAMAIILGAFGAHYVKDKLDEAHIHLFETAVRYQFYGCIGLIIMGLLVYKLEKSLKYPIALLRFGILVFCGAIYFLALRPVLGIEGMNWMGAIAPFGGLFMVGAWAWLGILFFIKSRNEDY